LLIAFLKVYNETYLKQPYMGPLFAFRIDRCLVYTGKINKDFLHWDFILSLVYTGV
jgi:hypothetical protein